MAETTVESRLSIQSLSSTIDAHTILRDVSLELGFGETIALCGRSGSGKTTLLKCVSTLQTPDTGNAYLDGDQYLSNGRTIRPAWTVRREISLVFQNYCLFPNLTGLRNITLALETVADLDRRDAEQLAREAAGALQIDGVLRRYPSEMSGGEQQRLALARALVLKPKVLLMDEVTSAVDPETANSMVDAIQQLREAEQRINPAGSRQMSIILVTHMFHFAESFADRIVFLSDGTIVENHLAKAFRASVVSEDAKRYLSYVH